MLHAACNLMSIWRMQSHVNTAANTGAITAANTANTGAITAADTATPCVIAH